MTRVRTVAANGVLALATAAFVFPIYWLVSSALKPASQLWASPPIFWPTQWIGHALATIAHDGLWVNFLHSAIASLGSTVIVLVLGTMAAYSLTRYPWRFGQGIASWVVSMKIMPPISVVLPLYLLLSGLRLYDTLPGLVLVYVLFNLPLAIWLLVGFFSQIPRALDESAWIDGATPWQTLLRIVGPLAAPSIAGVGAVSVMLAWNDFIFAVSLTSNHAATLPVVTVGFLGDFIWQWSSFYTAVVLEVLPMLVMAVFMQRYLVAGLSLGAFSGS